MTQLSDSSRVELERLCADFGLSQKTTAEIVFAAQLLRHFELHEKLQIPTQKQELENMSEVARLSGELSSAIARLHGVQKLRINYSAPKFIKESQKSNDVAEFSDDFLNIIDARLLVLREVILCTIDDAKEPKISGRKSIRGHYFAYLYLVWRAIDGEGLALGRNGPFQRLCDAVFQAAGVHSSSEGSVRFFVENLPKNNAFINFCEGKEVE